MNDSNENISVLIVDDESIIRQRIALHVRNAGYMVIGSAADGETALQMLNELHPDIVITDIVMPFFSGVELQEKAREAGFHTRFIFITGHNDFSFAVSALKNHADDYLLKPIDAREMLASLAKATGEVRELRRRQEMDVDYTSIKTAAWLYRYLEGEDLEPETESVLRIFENISDFRLLLVYSGSPMDTMPGRPYLLPNGLYLYFVTRNAMNSLTKFPSGSSYRALGNPMTEISRLRTDYHSLRRTLLWRFFAPDVHVFVQEDCRQRDGTGISSDFRSRNEELLQQKHYSRLKAAVAEEVHTLTHPHALEMYAASLLSLFREYSLRMKHDFPWQTYSALWVLERFGSLDEFIDYLCDAIDSLGIGEDAGLTLVERVRLYLCANYARPRLLSLETIGLRVFAHPNYISTRFKEETGMTVVEYLTSLRLEKARELLQTTSMTCVQVARTVGFMEPGYFSKCFKKKYGYPPSLEPRALEA